MASAPVQISAAVLASATTLYTAFVDGGATWAILSSLDFCNTGTTDITVDVWYENSGASVTRYFAKTLTVPAKGVASYRGMQTITTSGDKWRAIASATNVDCTGTVTESA